MSNISKVQKILYTAHAKVSGGREGHAETDDGLILRPVRHDNHERQANAARVVMDKYEAELQKLAK